MAEWIPSFRADYGLYRDLKNGMPPLDWSWRGRPIASDYAAADNADSFTSVSHGPAAMQTMFGFNLYTASGPGGEARFANKALLFNFGVSNFDEVSWYDSADFDFEIVLWDLITDTKTQLAHMSFGLSSWVHDYTEPWGAYEHIYDARTELYFVLDTNYDDEGVTRIGFGYANFCNSFSTDPDSGWGGQDLYSTDGLAISVDDLPDDLFPIPKEIKDPNDDPDDPEPPWPGPGPHSKPRDPIQVPPLPTLSPAGAGFITLYKLLPTEMAEFASTCFDADIWDVLKHLFGKPADFVAGITICPFTPPGLTRWKPKFSWGGVALNWTHAYTMVDNTFVEINCGNITVEPFYNNCFDYSPYTKLTIWLPYIGYREIDADDVMGHNINVTYHCDCLSGACVAFISIAAVGPSGPDIPRVLYQYNGNVLTQVPVDSVSMDSMLGAAVGLAGAAASVAAIAISAGAAAGAVGAGAAAAEPVAVMGAEEAAGATLSMPSAMSAAGARAGLTASTANAVQSMKPRVSRGGTLSSTAGYMGVQKPYLIKRLPIQSLPDNYIDLYGYPCNMGGTLADYSGYTEVDNIQLNDIPATIPEISEIYQLLKGGIIL